MVTAMKLRRTLFTLLALTALCVPARAGILRVEIGGPIGPITAEFLRRAVDAAAQHDDALLLVRLNTPGGLGVSMQQIVETILNSPVPVAVYVAPSGARAASAGFFILLAGDVAAMTEGTNAGAAHPVFPFGGENKILLEKATNDAMASLRSIAEKRGRNRELAEKAVSENKSFTEREAVAGKLIDLIAKDEPDLLAQIDRNASLGGGRLRRPLVAQPIETLEMTFRERVLAALSNPNLAVLLGVLGLLGIYIEFTHPGLVLPGVAGTIAFLLALVGFSLLPINYIAVLLIVLALGLLVAEVKVQGFGVLGIGGAIALVLGLLFLVEAPDPAMRVRLSVAIGAALPLALILILLLRLTVRAHRRRVQTGTEVLLGQTGTTRTPVLGSGKVFVSGELWEAFSHKPIEVDRRVRVLRVEGLKLEVEETTSGETS